MIWKKNTLNLELKHLRNFSILSNIFINYFKLKLERLHSNLFCTYTQVNPNMYYSCVGIHKLWSLPELDYCFMTPYGA